MKKVAFFTIGCKLNFSETSIIKSNFIKDKNYKIVSFNEYSNIYIINTCTVTNNAVKDFKKKINKILKINKKAYIVAIGCHSQVYKNDLYKLNGIKLVLGNNDKFEVKKYLEKKINSCELFTPTIYKDAYSLEYNRVRSFLKIQDGCNYKCTYCTIPLARGPSRSNSVRNIIKNIKYLLKKNVKEIVLTGINIGDYKNKNDDLFSLIKKINKIKKIKRVRISSIEPNLLKNKIIKFIANNKKFVNHFHIPLQSGSNFILNKMKRRYLIKTYLEKIKLINKLIPDACIGSDIIVGFPGETNKDFVKTFKLIKSIKITYLHVFSFSKRENTEAYNMKNIVKNNVIRYRSKKLRNLSYKKTRKFYKSFLGTTRKVLFENIKNKYIYGYTDNYIRVRLKTKKENKLVVNKIIKVYLNKLHKSKNVVFGIIKKY